MAQIALPGLAPNPYRLEPLRPSYTKLCRQLEAVARRTGKPVDQLTVADLTGQAEASGWVPATLNTLRRVAHAHGLNIEPASNPRTRSRPEGVSLSQFTITGPDNPPTQQRTAALATLLWAYPAPLRTWRRLTFADLTFSAGDVAVMDRTCLQATAVLIWRDTVREWHPDVPGDRLPFLIRLDGALMAAGERVLELDWAEWVGGHSLDRWRAWAIDNGAIPVDRGLERHRHR